MYYIFHSTRYWGPKTRISIAETTLPFRGTNQKRKRDGSDEEEATSSSKEPKKKAKREKGEKLPPLPAELVARMKALVDYIVEYEDK